MFAFNQELTRDIGNHVPLEKVVAVHCTRMFAQFVHFRYSLLFSQEPVVVLPPEPDKTRSHYGLISFHLLLDMRGGHPINYWNF